MSNNNHPNRKKPTKKQILEARTAAMKTPQQAANSIGHNSKVWIEWENGLKPMPAGMFRLFLKLNEIKA